MATSGSTNYASSRDNIINEAAEIIGIKDFEESLSANELSSCARSLEYMIKYWHSKGIYLWKTKKVYMFFADDTVSYDLGPTGDHATLSYVKTELSAAAAAAASTITVDSITGISDADKIGIELSDGTLQWTTVNGSPSGSTITLTAALTGAASVDANVFTYTTIIDRPLFVTDDVQLYRDSSANRLPVKVVSRRKYNSISTRTSEGPVNQIYYDPQTTNGKLWVWPSPDSVKDVLEMTCKMPVEDFDSAANEPDFPQEWFLCLAWNLAVHIAPKFNKPAGMDIQARAQAMLDDLIYFDKDYGSVFFEAE